MKDEKRIEITHGVFRGETTAVEVGVPDRDWLKIEEAQLGASVAIQDKTKTVRRIVELARGKYGLGSSNGDLLIHRGVLQIVSKDIHRWIISGLSTMNDRGLLLNLLSVKPRAPQA